MMQNRSLVMTAGLLVVLLCLGTVALLRRRPAEPRAQAATAAARGQTFHAGSGSELLAERQRTPFVTAPKEVQGAAMDRTVVHDMLLALERAAAAGDERLVAAIQKGLARHGTVSREMVADRLRNSHDAMSRATLEETAAKLR